MPKSLQLQMSWNIHNHLILERTNSIFDFHEETIYYPHCFATLLHSDWSSLILGCKKQCANLHHFETFNVVDQILDETQTDSHSARSIQIPPNKALIIWLIEVVVREVLSGNEKIGPTIN